MRLCPPPDGFATMFGIEVDNFITHLYTIPDYDGTSGVVWLDGVWYYHFVEIVTRVINFFVISRLGRLRYHGCNAAI